MPDRSMSKHEPYGITAYTNRGQGVFLVLFALNDSVDPIRSRTSSSTFRRAGGKVTRHVLPPYESQNEPEKPHPFGVGTERLL